MSILITRLLYSQTVKKPSGTFEKLEAEGLTQGNPEQAFNELKSFVESSLGYPDSTPSDKIEENLGGGKVVRTDGKIVTAIDNKEVVDEPKAKKGTKASKKVKEEIEQEVEAEEENSEAETVEEEVVEASKKKVTKVPPPKSKKNTPYVREDESLKARFTELMYEEFPNWKKDKVSLENAKKTSLAMVGEDFLDSDGNVLDSFKASLRTNMESDL